MLAWLPKLSIRDFQYGSKTSARGKEPNSDDSLAKDPVQKVLTSHIFSRYGLTSRIYSGWDRAASRASSPSGGKTFICRGERRERTYTNG